MLSQGCINCTEAVAGIPTSLPAIAVAVGGLPVGLGWMWRIYRAPTRFEEPPWRYRDR